MLFIEKDKREFVKGKEHLYRRIDNTRMCQITNFSR
jgi:hypothetical protein